MIVTPHLLIGETLRCDRFYAFIHGVSPLIVTPVKPLRDPVRCDRR